MDVHIIQCFDHGRNQKSTLSTMQILLLEYLQIDVSKKKKGLSSNSKCLGLFLVIKQFQERKINVSVLTPFSHIFINNSVKILNKHEMTFPKAHINLFRIPKHSTLVQTLEL